jgi:hypothetical protein
VNDSCSLPLPPQSRADYSRTWKGTAFGQTNPPVVILLRRLVPEATSVRTGLERKGNQGS